MSESRVAHDGVLDSLGKVHQAALKQLDQFDRALTHLQFEGKSSRGRNAKQIDLILQFFKEKLINHMDLEEQILFPFLESHVPKLGPVLSILCSQHEDFKRNVKDLELFLGSLLNAGSELEHSKMIYKIRETGTYLIYLLRHHIQVETESVYKTIDRELRPNEKKGLERQVQEHAER